METLHPLFPSRPSIERSANNSVNSYNRYLAVASRVVRRSLKDDKRIIAERRGESELRFAKWSVSYLAPGYWRLGWVLMGIQNGKQGEMKNLTTANQESVKETAAAASS
jgi:hypothetical protein